MNRCKRCLLPEVVPGAALDAAGICGHCHQFDRSDPEKAEAARREREQDLEKALEDCRGRAAYDAVVCLSGGKDSLYLLHRLKTEYRLNILALTTDHGINAVARDNIARAVRKLDVDHCVYRPSRGFYDKLFRYLLQNQEERGAVYTISYVYAPLFEGDAIRLAVEKGIPLVLAGYSPGQPEEERMVYEFAPDLVTRTDWTPPELAECGAFSRSELSRFWNPLQCPEGTRFPRYLAPFHAWPYHQSEIIERVVSAGLAARKKHANPIFSNSAIQWLLMYSDLKNFGYNPYHPEFSSLIRAGKASRRYWRVAGPIIDYMIRHKCLTARHAARMLRYYDLTEDDLKINRERGAYDPVIGESPAYQGVGL